MKVGITLPNLGPQATRENVLKLATQAEKDGFDSLWTITRILWPLKPQSAYAATPDGSLPNEYQNVLDPLDVLVYVAANTTKIALGTSVADLFFYTPIMLAKRFATLDVLSQGRVISGLGLGWSKDEYQASNIPFMNRGERADEFIRVMKKIWTDDIVEFKGKYYDIPASKIDPKPIQKPHIPIYLGGSSPNTFSRIVKYDLNGWLGVVGGPLEYIESSIKAIKEQASQANKNPDNFRIIMMTYPNVKEDISSKNDKNRFPLSGTIDEIGNDIQRVRGMGVDHIIFGYNFLPIGRDIAKILDISKQLSKFAR
ncbi:MAG: TIGR03619 family F420-dependent LLM class oxidoreductase [Thermoproteota archaeon]|nr:TIGR03619 family F420-dependent LLM class oxidoreductase [Thermoproteota archaeon]